MAAFVVLRLPRHTALNGECKEGFAEETQLFRAGAARIAFSAFRRMARAK
jgi:hypothetical protein